MVPQNLQESLPLYGLCLCLKTIQKLLFALFERTQSKAVTFNKKIFNHCKTSLFDNGTSLTILQIEIYTCRDIF